MVWAREQLEPPGSQVHTQPANTSDKVKQLGIYRGGANNEGWMGKLDSRERFKLDNFPQKC